MPPRYLLAGTGTQSRRAGSLARRRAGDVRAPGASERDAGVRGGGAAGTVARRASSPDRGGVVIGLGVAGGPERRSSYSRSGDQAPGRDRQRRGAGSRQAWLASAVCGDCGRMVERACLSLCEVRPASMRTAALTPAVLSTIGRRLARDGESIWRIVTTGGRIRLIEGSHVNVAGGGDPATWEYDLTTYGPTTSTTGRVPAAAVIHCRYAWHRDRPWIGVSPADFASGGRRPGRRARRPVEPRSTGRNRDTCSNCSGTSARPRRAMATTRRRTPPTVYDADLADRSRRNPRTAPSSESRHGAPAK